MNRYKKFITPREFMKKFNVDKETYKSLIYRGLPSYDCAGVTRHPIDEIYLWFEEKRIMLEDSEKLCNATQLAHVFSVSVSMIAKWELMGLPKHVINRGRGGRRKIFAYDPEEVLVWLRSQHEGVRV